MLPPVRILANNPVHIRPVRYIRATAAACHILKVLTPALVNSAVSVDLAQQTDAEDELNGIRPPEQFPIFNRVRRTACARFFVSFV